MSHNPKATQEVSNNPGKTSVTHPTDPKFKVVDSERKLRFYGVLQALRAGKYPTNEQISETLDYTVNHSPIETSNLSSEGQTLIEDFREIIRTAKQIVEEKNADELVQNFLYHTRQVDYSKGNLKGITPGVSQDERERDAQQAIEHLRTLGKLIFTNSEARKLLKDFGVLGRDVLADAAVKAGEAARPSEDELARADEPAPSNQWVGPDGTIHDHTQKAPDTGLAEKRAKAQEAKEKAKAEKDNLVSQAQGHAENIADAADQGQQSNIGQSDQARAEGAANAGQDQAQAEGEKAKATAKSKLNELKAKIPQEQVDRANEQLDRAKSYAKDKFPEERRDRFIYRMKKVIVENQRHRDYQEAIEFFLDRAENYGKVTKDASAQGGGKLLDVRNDSAFRAAEDELRTVLERFANGASMQPIIDAVDQLYKDAEQDEELRNWFRRLDSYVREVLQTPGYIMKEQCDRDGRQLIDDGKRFWDVKNGKYAGHKDNFFDSISTFFTSYADDPLNVQLGNNVKKLTTDLLYDSDGKLAYKPHLVADIKHHILPALATNIGYVPIPRIEYTDDQIDLVIENLTLESANLLPNVIELEARNYFKLSPYSEIKDVTKHSFWISFSQIQADLRDVSFYIKRKSGFPKLTDEGQMDVFLGGKGISGKVHLESTGRKHHVFNVKDVSVKLDSLKLAIRNKRHNILVAMLKPLAQGLIKKGIAKAIEGAIRDGLQQLDAQLADISERVEEAEDEEGAGKFTKVKKAFAEKKSEAEQKKEEAKPAGQFQITTDRDSRLVNWSGPDSIVDKAAERVDAAKGGDGWKSDAFWVTGDKAKLKGGNSVGGTTTGAARTADPSTTVHQPTVPVVPGNSASANVTSATAQPGAPTTAPALGPILSNLNS
ncbi:hypothetical protein OIO90_004645 [Microbotryomycetes sp. JL221]|nr:hypothetical protein OIO90_004645 [Microbotryomycetes sp. JL221]